MVHVPPEHREAAEAIRKHLVFLRGGAVFLSSADALKLLRWLDDAIPVPDILRAIERAAEARQKTRSRVPLGLRHVARHLGKDTPGLFRSPGAPAPVEAGLQPLIRLIRERAAGDPLDGLLRQLAADLDGLPQDDRLARDAMIRVRLFHEAVFEALSEDRRAALRRAARDDLGDLVHLLEERDLGPLIEESARAAAREGYAWLSAATVWDLVRTEESS